VVKLAEAFEVLVLGVAWLPFSGELERFTAWLGSLKVV
jgi:hypothetical protein